MRIRNVLVFTVMMMMLSAAEEKKKSLTGVVGGNITLPDPVPERGFLIYQTKNIASVSKGEFELEEQIYENKLHWDKTSGLFLISDLQKNDSGVYTIDSKKGRVVTASYDLTVYDSAPTPAVSRLSESSEGCRLLCSVDQRSALLWYKDEEILDQNQSVFSLLITLHKPEPDSSYRCVSANPADRKDVDVDVETSCGFIRDEKSENSRTNWVAVVVVPVFVAFVILAACLKQKFLSKKTPRHSADRDVVYTSVQIHDVRNSQGGNPTSSGGGDSSTLTSVYAKLEPRFHQSDVNGSTDS